MKKKTMVIALSSLGLVLSLPLAASAGFFDDFWDGFHEGVAQSYQEGARALSDILSEHDPEIESAVTETVGVLGLSDVLSIEASVLEQAQRGEHVLVLTEPAPALQGEIQSRRIALDVAKVLAASILSSEGQERLVEKTDLIEASADAASAFFEEADQAISSQTAIKRLAAITLTQTELMSGLSTEFTHSQVGEAAQTQVLVGLAEQFDEQQSLALNNQRRQMELLILAGFGTPVTFGGGNSQ